MAKVQAQSLPPQAYTLSATTYTTEVSMFTGQAANLKLARNGSKELVALTVPPWEGNSQGVHMRYLFDFQEHKAYSQDLDHNSCSWIKYVSARAPVNYDPITAIQGEESELAEAKKHAVGRETVNGVPALITEGETKIGTIRTWFAEKGGFVVKVAMTDEGGKSRTLMEVQEVQFSPPEPSLLVPPGNCETQAAGEWSDHKVSAHAQAKIDVQGSATANMATGQTQAQVTAQLHQGSSSSGSETPAAKPGGGEGDFLDSTDTLNLPPATKNCTVLFRVVRSGTMEPVTSGLQILLDNRDMTSQYRNGLLRISNPPSSFFLQVEEKNGAGRAAQLSRACFRPETVLLLVLGREIFTDPDHWYWVKSGKYATVP